MKAKEILDIKNLIKDNIVKGDYIVLGKMLGIDKSAANMRFIRDNEEAVLAMQKIVENREQLIRSYKEKTAIPTINGLPEGFAVLDCISAKTGRLVVLLITNYKNHDIVYSDVETMDAECHLFIERVLKHDKVTSIITDCSLGYLPSVIKTIKTLGVKQFYTHRFANRSEAIMQLLSKRY